jgi:hypothetical protein
MARFVPFGVIKLSIETIEVSEPLPRTKFHFCNIFVAFYEHSHIYVAFDRAIASRETTGVLGLHIEFRTI